MPPRPGAPTPPQTPLPWSDPEFASSGAVRPTGAFEAGSPAAGGGGNRPELEAKLAELEKRLEKEKEKVLLASLKNQQEAVLAAQVESTIKDVQDKIRRERREQEMQENRVGLEARIQELESRLTQERETWVSTLKGQLQTREVQERESEAHFTGRLQEMERKFLEEKAHWQKVLLSKDDEVRNLRALAEKLKEAASELDSSEREKERLAGAVQDLTREKMEMQAIVASAREHEKENVQLKAELQLARSQAAMLQEKLERDLQAVRLAAKEREDRFLSDNERLQRDLSSVAERLRVEHESQIRRLQAEHESEGRRLKSRADLTSVSLQRVRAVASALERQLAQARGELVQARGEIAQTKKTAADATLGMSQKLSALLETEKLKIKMKAQEELNARLTYAQTQMEKERQAEHAQMEAKVVEEADREMSRRAKDLSLEMEGIRAKFASEIDRLHREIGAREKAAQDRLAAKDAEVAQARTFAGELRGRLAKEEEFKKLTGAERLDLTRAIRSQKEEMGGLQGEMQALREKLAKEEKWREVLAQEKADLEQHHGLRQSEFIEMQKFAEELKGRLSKEEETSRRLVQERDELTKTLQAKTEELRKGSEVWRQKVEIAKREVEGRLRALEAELQIERDRRQEVERKLSGGPPGSSASRLGKLFGRSA